MRAHDEQPGLRIEARRAVVGQAAFVGRDQAPVGSGFLRGIRDRLALLVDARRPVHRAEGRGQQALARGPVEHEEVAVARSLHQHLARLCRGNRHPPAREFPPRPNRACRAAKAGTPMPVCRCRDRARRCCRYRDRRRGAPCRSAPASDCRCPR